MNLKKYFTRKTLAIAVLVALVAAVCCFFALNSYIYDQKQDGSVFNWRQDTFEPYRATLTGEQVCLPHADLFSPNTDECAFGIRTLSGEHYALDFNLMSQMIEPMPNGTTFTASGVVTPVERLSSNRWRGYDIEGIFSVTDSVTVNGQPVPALPVPPPQAEPAAPSAPSAPSTAPAMPPSPVSKESPTGPCYVGGCSSQICSGQPDAMSTCEYREEYACYQAAKCERQATGLCGWTETAALRSCLGR